ncbi:MAG: type IV pilus twitching motility protein PilT [Bradymonadia bacterium]
MQALKQILQKCISLGAESVQLREGYPPHYLTPGLPATTGAHSITEAFLTEVGHLVLTAEDQRMLREQGRVKGEYHDEDAHTYRYVVKTLGSGLAFAFRPETSTALTIEHTALDEGNELDALFSDRTIMGILRTVLDYQVSDVVISSDRPTRIRMGGQYQRLTDAVFTASQILEFFGDDLTPERHRVLSETGSLDLGFEILDANDQKRRFRVNIFRHMEGLATAWRPIWDKVPSMESLRLPSQLLELAQLPYGLVLITGPTGSGKSTTLAALVEYINTNFKRHIITLEDPIEYRFRDRSSVIHQREVGIHVNSFSNGLRSALREAPDVILVGEMRDQDTISAALTAAETGHLVLSTLHSGHSAQAIDRIVDVFPEHQQLQVRVQLSDTLRALVTQRLLPTPDAQSRVPVVELVKVTYAVSNTIREGRLHQLSSLIQSGTSSGMISFDSSLAKLVREGVIERALALSCARDRSLFESLLKRY